VTPTRTIGRYGRTYVWPEKKPHELQVPSVTTVLSGGVPKPALAPWNAKMVATFAVKNKDAWEKLEEDDAIDLLKRSPFRKTKIAADRGSLVHRALDAFAAGEDHVVPKEKQLRAQYDGALQFLRDFKVEPEHTEVTIFSRQHGYAGTTDVVGNVVLPKELDIDDFMNPRKREGSAIIDYKTGKAIYDEAVIQANGYAFGDFIADGATGQEIPLKLVDFLIIVRPKRRGGYEVKVFEPSTAVHNVFLAALVVSAREDACAQSFVGRMLTGPEEDD
jgi:hypothetical protein